MIASAVVLVVALAALTLPTLEPDPAQATQRLVRVGVYENEPKIFTGEDGKPAGIFIDLIVAIAKEEGWTLEFVPGSWEEGLAGLSAGSIDLMPDVGYSADRDEVYDFHATPVADSYSRVYTAPGVDVERLSDLAGKRVAVLAGSVQEVEFARMADGYRIALELVPTNSLKEAFEYASDGRADAAIANYIFGDYFYRDFGLDKTAVVFNATPLYFATAQGENTDLLAAIDRHLDEWLDEPNSLYYQTMQRYTTGEAQLRWTRTVLWALGGTGVLLLLALAAVALLRWQVRVRTAALVVANQAAHAAEEDARRQNALMAALVDIMRTPVTSEREFLERALSKARELTDSPLGYISYYSEETGLLELNSWTDEVMGDCSIDNPPAVFSLESAGLWGEVIRQRQPIIINDFAADNPLKRGYPTGHVPITRYLSVPIMTDERIEAVIAVANSSRDYTADIDAVQLLLFMSSVWKELSRVRADTRRRELEEIASRGPAVAFTWSLEPGWPITFVSRNVDQFGYSAEELTRGAHFADLVHPDDLEWVGQSTAEQLAGPGQEAELEYRILTADGEVRWVYDVSWVAQLRDDQPVVNQGILVDITERREAEIELEQHRNHLEDLVEERTRDLAAMNARLDSSNEALIAANVELERALASLTAANQRLEEATTAKSRFLATMSHELRTPLNSIIGFSDLLGKGMVGPLTDEEMVQIGIINKSGRQLLGLINDILDLSKVEAGSMELRPGTVDLAALTVEVTDSLRPLAAEKGLDVSAITSEEPIVILSDPERVRQIITNIVGNAVKFTETGSVTVAVSCEQDGTARVTVTDTGPGIPEKELHYIFDAFRQAERVSGAHPTGTGLGLAISKDLATLLGGSIEVESAVGQGSTFTLTLPASCALGSS